jgi:hypothetical protein
MTTLVILSVPVTLPTHMILASTLRSTEGTVPQISKLGMADVDGPRCWPTLFKDLSVSSVIVGPQRALERPLSRQIVNYCVETELGESDHHVQQRIWDDEAAETGRTEQISVLAARS